MFDENDRSSHPDDTSRHIRRGARHEDDKTIEVDSAAFFAPELPPAPVSAAQTAREQTTPHKAPEPPREHKMTIPGEPTPKRGVILLVLQAILSVGALVQLWRTQMLPALYLILHRGAAGAALAAGQALPGVQDPGRCVPGVLPVPLCAGLAVGCVWAQQGLAALDNVTSGLITGAEANKITKEPFVVYLSGVDNRGELTEKARSDVNILPWSTPPPSRWR